MADDIIPDLQACVLCEDVRQEASGQQTLVGIIGMIPAPVMPIGFFKLCLWTRWCGGSGDFLQTSLILNPDDDQPIAQSEVRFSLPSLEAHATNVHVFGGDPVPEARALYRGGQGGQRASPALPPPGCPGPAARLS